MATSPRQTLTYEEWLDFPTPAVLPELVIEVAGVFAD